MTKFTEADIQQLMRKAADDPDLQFPQNWIDKEFQELDFDSLSVLELATLVQKQYGVAMSDEVVEDLTTPRSFQKYVEDRLSEDN